MKALLAKNTITRGLLIGLSTLSLIWLSLLLVKTHLSELPAWLASDQKSGVVSLAPNIILIRIFFVNLKEERTGKGLLLVTFLAMLVIFLLL